MAKTRRMIWRVVAADDIVYYADTPMLARLMRAMPILRRCRCDTFSLYIRCRQPYHTRATYATFTIITFFVIASISMFIAAYFAAFAFAISRRRADAFAMLPPCWRVCCHVFQHFDAIPPLLMMPRCQRC